MALRAIAAGDSLARDATVPPELGDLLKLSFDAAMERAGRVDQRRRIVGQVLEIDPVGRSVTISWPFGKITAGRWRVQIRAAGPHGVSTFVLDEELVVEPSMLPLRTQWAAARLGRPPLRLVAEGTGGAYGDADIRLPSLRMYARGREASSIGHVILGLPRLRMVAEGSGREQVTAELRLLQLRLSGQGIEAPGTAAARIDLARLRLSGQGSGREQLTAKLRLPPFQVAAEGAGVRPEADAAMRLSLFRIVAEGNGLRADAVALVRLPRVHLSAVGESYAGPSVPTLFFSPGSAPGEVDLVVAEPPASLGDGPIAGDAAGTFTGLVIQIGAAAPVTYDTTIPREVTSSGHTPGASVSATVQAIGYGGRPGALGFATTTATADPAADFVALVDPATGYVITSGGVVWAVRAPEEI